jgi:hypothetical protein
MNRHLLALTATLVLAAGAAHAQFQRGQQPAGIAVEITAEPTRATSGALSRNAFTGGTVIAQRTVRVRDAAVLLDTVKTVSREIPAGTALARLDRVGSEEPAWCDMRKLSLFNHLGVDCLEDRDHDGRLDRVVYGHVTALTPVSIDYVTKGEPLPAAASIRPAKPDERPTVEIGYLYCKGDGATDPPRFAFAVKTGDRDFDSDSIDCRFGAWVNAEQKLVSVDGLELKITPGDKLRYELTRDYTPGPLGPIAPGQSLVAAAKDLTPKAKLAEVLQPPLRAVGAAQAHEGEVKVGDVILTIPVTHTITGRLTAPVKAMGLLPPRLSLPAGQAVFGVPMTGGEIVWCAPQETTDKAGARTYSTVCLPQGPGGGTRWVPVVSPMFVSALRIDNIRRLADAPIVAREPVDFGVPMTLVYKFFGVRDGRVYVQIEVQSPIGTSHAGAHPVLMAKGFGVLPALQGAVKITPASDGKTATIEVPKPLGADGALFL